MFLTPPPHGEAAESPLRVVPEDPGGVGEGEGASGDHCGGCVHGVGWALRCDETNYLQNKIKGRLFNNSHNLI